MNLIEQNEIKTQVSLAESSTVHLFEWLGLLVIISHEEAETNIQFLNRKFELLAPTLRVPLHPKKHARLTILPEGPALCLFKKVVYFQAVIAG